MRKYIILFILAVSASLLASSCRTETLNPESIIKAEVKQKNDFDKWLDANYLNPYNISVKYRYEMDESDYSYYTIPADMECSIIMAHLIKYLCIDTYDEVAGIEFTREYFPKMFFYLGEWEYKNNGTYILGTAEGGKKIYLTGVNYIKDVLNGNYQGYTVPAEGINHFYVKTIHHEFTHILNQLKEYPADFKQITASDYVQDSWNEYSGNLPLGFISSYARANDREDFAEMMSLYVTHDQTWWDEQLATEGKTGAGFITSKLDIVRSYMNNSFGIDIDELRSTVLRRQEELINGEVDLTSLDII